MTFGAIELLMRESILCAPCETLENSKEKKKIVFLQKLLRVILSPSAAYLMWLHLKERQFVGFFAVARVVPSPWRQQFCCCSGFVAAGRPDFGSTLRLWRLHRRRRPVEAAATADAVADNLEVVGNYCQLDHRPFGGLHALSRRADFHCTRDSIRPTSAAVQFG